MMRVFRTHESRNVVDLGGIWEFAFIEDADAAAIDPSVIDPSTIETDDVIAVPGCFDASPRYAGKRGIGVYRKAILLRDESRHRLTFNGVHHWCRIFLVQGGKSRLLSEHSGGYTVFSTDIRGHVPGRAEIVVLVDNRFDPERCPTHLEYFDWYHYGGITRGAELARLGERWIDSVRIETIDYASRRIRCGISCGSEEDGEDSLAIEIDGVRASMARIVYCRGIARTEIELELHDCELWSSESPSLHTARFVLGEDDLIERFGIRQVSVEGESICINGDPVRLIGFCRHEAHPQFGCGLPAAIQIEDIQLLEEMGCNFVRGSHYPQDPVFLDLCDERGILVWDEAIGWQHRVEHFENPAFIEAQLLDIREMIDSAVNHPSVIMWGLLNESESNNPGNRSAYEKLIGEIRCLDPTRPVTYASNKWPNDLFHDLVDIVSINAYPGWYSGSLEDIRVRFESMIEAIDASTSAGKPFIVSEIGAGAIPGWRDRNRTRWSEEYQAELLEEVISNFLAMDRICGIAIWQFCDCRTSEIISSAVNRPRVFNNKGVVDEYRKPKLGFDVVKRKFGG